MLIRSRSLFVTGCFLLLTFGRVAVAEDKGVCPPLPMIPNKTARLEVGDRAVTAKVLTVISDTGYVCSARLLNKAEKEVAAQVERGIRKWHFEPAKKDGKGVAVLATIEVNVKRDENGKIVFTSDPVVSGTANGTPSK